jgi:hypothetical protein
VQYQDESNADNMDDALAYSNNFKNFINSWRGLWGFGDSLVPNEMHEVKGGRRINLCSFIYSLNNKLYNYD